VICGRSVATLEIARDGLFLSRDADGLPIARSSHAALALGAVTGVVIFLAMSGLSHLLLRRWHESAMKQER